jgi:hypothetical protein
VRMGENLFLTGIHLKNDITFEIRYKDIDLQKLDFFWNSLEFS